MSGHPTGIQVRDLVKSFDGQEALRGVSLDVDAGELFGIIGPDGAGKTTLLRILVTVLAADSGSATLNGRDVERDYRAIRNLVGYMPGRFSLYPDLTVRENLEFFASVFGTTVEAQYDAIAPIYAQIEPFNDRRAGALSGGMKQKLALSCALVHQPEILILDEPTTGVDAVSRAEFWDILAEFRSTGITTLVSTPYMDEAARCDRVALMQDGRFLGPPDRPAEVARRFRWDLLQVRASGDRARFLADVRTLPGIHRAEVFGEWIHVSMDRGHGGASADPMRSALEAKGWLDVTVEPVEATIEDVFMDQMGADTVEAHATT